LYTNHRQFPLPVRSEPVEGLRPFDKLRTGQAQPERYVLGAPVLWRQHLHAQAV